MRLAGETGLTPTSLMGQATQSNHSDNFRHPKATEDRIVVSPTKKNPSNAYERFSDLWLIVGSNGTVARSLTQVEQPELNGTKQSRGEKMMDEHGEETQEPRVEDSRGEHRVRRA